MAANDRCYNGAILRSLPLDGYQRQAPANDKRCQGIDVEVASLQAPANDQIC